MSNLSYKRLSIAFSFALLGILLHFGVLIALLAASTSYLLAKALSSSRALVWAGTHATKVSSFFVAAIPLLMLTALTITLSKVAPDLAADFKGIMERIVQAVQSGKSWLPPAMAEKIPAGEALQQLLLSELQTRGGTLAAIGKDWAIGLLHVVVGGVIGVLIYLDSLKKNMTEGFSFELAQRAQAYIETFRNIIKAQFFIATVNTVFTAIYLFAILPVFDLSLPYSWALLAMTFVCSMLPVAGNLLVNTVLTLVSFSVGPAVALASLLFLVAVHKTEYFINAAVVGSNTKVATWEMLTAIFLGEAIFGLPGLVAAPLFYAYCKQELVRQD